MKRLFKTAAILAGLMLIFSICQQEEPEAPTLISPEDGAVFDTIPPTFVWSSDSLADDYMIRIYTDSTTELEDTLQDTTYTMSNDLFETLTIGTYTWAAATLSTSDEPLWSESRTFIIDKPEPGTLDLDTTYFPFGLGYEWCYERHDWGYNAYVDPVEEWDTTYIYTIKVTDSSFLGDTLFLQLEEQGGRLEHLQNPVRIWCDTIKVRMKFAGITATRHLLVIKPDPDSFYPGDYVSIGYNYDTLIISGCYEFTPSRYSTRYITRVEEIGALRESYYSVVPDASMSVTDRLLYFYNGQDTIYKSD